MEETIGECTNLHITYPAMVMGFFVLLRANRTVEDALEAPDIDPDEEPSTNEEEEAAPEEAAAVLDARIEANDIAIRSSGEPVEEIQRFHAALSELTGRRGIRDEISRYEAISLILVEPKGEQAGTILPLFPPAESPLYWNRFFTTLYQQYDERFVFGAPSLASRTRRRTWSSESPVFHTSEGETARWPLLDYPPRIS
jgi:hypothetical protein